MNHEEALRRIAELEAENERLLNELRKARNVIANAKDIEPIQRLSEKRVAKMAASACLELVRHKVKGWLIRMGNKSQWYRSLWDIWAILSGEDWKLSEIIPSTVTPKLVKEARLYSSLLDTRDEFEDALPKEESIMLDKKPRDYNFRTIPPVIRRPERHPSRGDRYKPTDAVPQIRPQNRSLAPNPYRPDSDSVAGENYTEVGKKKPTFVPAKDRYGGFEGGILSKSFETWWFINNERPVEQPKDLWYEGVIKPII
jgi:hypothetical protein